MWEKMHSDNNSRHAFWSWYVHIHWLKEKLAWAWNNTHCTDIKLKDWVMWNKSLCLEISVLTTLPMVLFIGMLHICGPSLNSGLPMWLGKVWEGTPYNRRNQEGGWPCSQGLLITFFKAEHSSWALSVCWNSGPLYFSAAGEWFVP